MYKGDKAKIYIKIKTYFKTFDRKSKLIYIKRNVKILPKIQSFI